MLRLVYYFLFVGFIALSVSCKKKSVDNPVKPDVPDFSIAPTNIPVVPLIDETSGIADSKLNTGNLWVHEDSGNGVELFLVSKQTGKTTKKIVIKGGAANRDWEDMCLAGGNIYIADIGDNSLRYTNYNIYTFPEPPLTTDTVKTVSTIRFKYAEGKHDAEAILVDPQSKDIFIITKNDPQAAIYKIASPYSITALNTAVLVGNLDYTNVVSAALSNSGKEIIVKTYTSLHLYSRGVGQTIPDALKTNSRLVNYVLEPQGEAVTFATDDTGFYTMSEKGLSSAVNLYWYKRK